MTEIRTLSYFGVIGYSHLSISMYETRVITPTLKLSIDDTDQIVYCATLCRFKVLQSVEQHTTFVLSECQIRPSWRKI